MKEDVKANVGDSNFIPPPSSVIPFSARIWTEPRVRFWWIAAVALLAISIGYAIEGFLEWRTEADLIQHGTLVQATISEAGGAPPHRPITENAAWDVKFQLNGQTQVETGYPPDESAHHFNGDVVPIRVDPNDPEKWTNRTTPPPLSHNWVGLPFILAMGALCVIFALVRMARLRKAVREGRIGSAKILSLGQSALAPRSYLARCTWADESSSAVYTVFIPRSKSPTVGSEIQIAAAENSGLAMNVT